ncbi:MAG: alpha/beta hydrolase fold domain-containing protein [Lachnospiraceae bacterium]|nr:alpha/beta hydrolase fold domain-containing protein [Lachnospiraceae bacterium]
MVYRINTNIDSIDKLYKWLKERTEGYRIITVGNSAGGYMAALMGSLLKAEMVFDFSGQFSLYATKDVLTKYALLKKYSEDKERKYFDICDYMKHNENVMYFWPGKSESDIVQYELVKATKIYSFKFKVCIHGQSMYSANIPYLLVQDKQYLVDLYKNYEGKDIVKEEFFIRTKGVKALVMMYLLILKKKIIK